LAGNTPFEQHLARSLETIQNNLQILNARLATHEVYLSSVKDSVRKLPCAAHGQILQRLDRRAWLVNRLMAAAVTVAGIAVGAAHLLAHYWKGHPHP